jgi:hypothetical protein
MWLNGIYMFWVSTLSVRLAWKQSNRFSQRSACARTIAVRQKMQHLTNQSEPP